MRKVIALLSLTCPLLFASACDEREHHHKHEAGDGEHEHKHQHEHEHEHEHDYGRLDEVAVRFVDFHLTVLGDSVSVGLLGDTHMGMDMPLEHKFFSTFLAGEQRDRAAVDAYYKQNFKGAFSSGKHCVSLACRIEHGQFRVDNLAVSGARAATDREGDIAGQLARADTSTTHYVLEIGNNDFCALDFDKDKTVAAMSKVSENILARGANVQLLIVPVMPIVRLFREVALPTDTAFTRDGTTYTCEQIRGVAFLPLPPERRKAASFCPRLDGVTDEGEFDTLQAELDAVNNAIVTLAHTVNTADAAATAMNEPRVTVATSLLAPDFDKSHLAADCFHPSRAGLELISAKVFEHVQTSWQPHRVVVDYQPQQPTVGE